MRFLVVFAFLVSLLQQQTALQAVVIDAAGQPVVGLRIDVETEDGAIHQFHIDNTGFSPITPLEGSQFSVTRVTQPDGSELTIETTTLDRLQLALLPGQTRTILFRVSDGLFAVDPETLFAGADTPPTVATMQAALSSAELPTPAESVAEGGERPAPSEPVVEQAASTPPMQEDLSALPTPIHEQAEPKQGEFPSLVIALVAFVVGALAGGVLWYLARKRGQP
jgi:hypothetical protein